MTFHSNQFTNEQKTSQNDDTSIYINDQQSNNPLSGDVETRFSPMTNSTLDSLSITELIDFHKKRSRKHMKYMLLVFGIIALIGFALLMAWLGLRNCTVGADECASTSLIFLTMGLTLIGTGVLCVLIGGCYGYYMLKNQFNDLNDDENRLQSVVWRLDGEEWIRYLNYIHGPDRQWTEAAPLSSFCCRRSSYDRLMNRQYGHIVLYGNGLIIDELYFISFRQYSLQGIDLLNISQDQQINGLRIHTYLKAGKNSRNCYFDIFAPSSVTLGQLQTIGQFYNGKISGINGLGTAAAINGLYLAGSILHTLH